jgi:phosphatidylserine/phosphatidylglycerophosphate/cardiolipin synthase-like enzyme
MKKPTNKLPHFELSGSSYFRVIQQFLDFTLLVTQYLNKNLGFSRVLVCIQSIKSFLLARRKIVSVFLFLAILFIATSSYAISSAAVFIITTFTFSWTLFLSSSKK